ncbi:hypothetical protein R50073_12900 [Maricurvus nonylphenolicus]|uniref:alpha/beta hydrolase n=1 Tax=Maricurvus nonylphenolicus TaxID=1008307 RepID=UPI0036F33165
MKVENHFVGDVFARRYTTDQPRYALVISHGIGGHGGIYDKFCSFHAQRGVDIWAYDAPGHGKSTPNRPRGTFTIEEWAQASRDLSEHVKEMTGLPVFTLGSSYGVAAAISARDHVAIEGVICMGSIAVPGSAIVASMTEFWRSDAIQKVIEQVGRAARLDIDKLIDFDEDYGQKGAKEIKLKDSYNTWSYDLASWVSFFNYEPPQPLGENAKPILYAYGSDDPNFPEGAVEMVASEISGPVTIKRFEDAGHQLMMFNTEEFSNSVDEFCLSIIA